MDRSNYYNQLWEYLLLISPPEDLSRTISRIRKEVSIKFGCEPTNFSCVSLARFLLSKSYERHLLTRLFSFCINRLPPEVRLSDFDVFPSHTLYIKIQEDDGLRKLQDTLTSLLINAAHVNERQLKASKRHYVTIAKDLNPVQFASVSHQYRGRRINASFIARDVVLLKRQYREYNSQYRWNGSHNFVMGC